MAAQPGTCQSGLSALCVTRAKLLGDATTAIKDGHSARVVGRRQFDLAVVRHPQLEATCQGVLLQVRFRRARAIGSA
jgi:hypothetical protein